MNADKEKVDSKTLGWHNSQPGNRKYIMFSEVGGSTPASPTLLEIGVVLLHTEGIL